jgi:hypothetical protein
MWLDDCRIPHNEPIKIMKPQDGGNKVYQQAGRREETTELKQQGRFTPNLLVCDDMLNDGIIYKSGDGSGNMELININDAHHFSYENPNRKITKMKGVQYNDKGTNSRYYDLDKWFDKVIDGL